MEMELLWRMMDEFASSWEHHEPSACIAGLPADEPSCLFPSVLYLDSSSVVGQPLKHPLSV
jgi:hypothetical protein